MPIGVTRGTAVLSAQGDTVELPRFVNGSFQARMLGLSDAATGLQIGDLVQFDELVERQAGDPAPSLIGRYTTPSCPPALDGFDLLPRTHDLGYVVRVRLLSALAGGRQIRVAYVVQRLA